VTYEENDGTRRPDPRLRVSPERVTPWRGTAWDGFPSPQFRTAVELVRALAARFGWDVSALSYTHAGFAAPRKTDPGRLWSEHVLPAVLAEGLGGPAPGSSRGGTA
jgi:hypothetical protein